jgi:hypothetical protein
LRKRDGSHSWTKKHLLFPLASQATSQAKINNTSSTAKTNPITINNHLPKPTPNDSTG